MSLGTRKCKHLSPDFFGSQFIIKRMRSSFVFGNNVSSFSHWDSKTFCLFPANFATSGNITRNNVSATMFPSLTRPYGTGKRGQIVADTSLLVSWATQTGKHLLQTQNVSEQNQKHFLCPQRMLRTRANGETFVSATMCHRLPGPLDAEMKDATNEGLHIKSQKEKEFVTAEDKKILGGDLIRNELS